MNIYQQLKDAEARYREKSAIVFAGVSVSFSEVRVQTLRLANGLRKSGVTKGDKVALCLPNSPEYIYSYLACFHIGAVAVPLDFMLKNDELTSCLDHSETKVLIARNRPDIDLAQIREEVPSLQTIILFGETPDGDGKAFLKYEDLLASISDEWTPVPIQETDPALIMYTSGTTGKPKGILLNYKHLEGSPQAMEYFVDLSDRDIKLAAIPLSHIGGFIYIQNMLTFGITLVLMDRFNPFQFLENIQRYRVTCFHIVPAMYHAILTLKHIENFDLSSLRWVVVFGAPSSPDILKRFQTYCPNARLLNGWGMTETCPPNTVTPMNSDNIASVGKPAPNCTIRILNEDGRQVPMGEVGEIVISGWVVMAGYYKDPEATADVMRENGLHTGDLGRFDHEGFLYIVGRKKEMIKVGGQIVYGPEVEAALFKNPDVAEAAVIGVPDALRGESVRAFVVLKEGSRLSAEDLRFFAREHLAHFKVPQTIEIRQDLPKNRTGKIDKNVLKDQILI